MSDSTGGPAKPLQVPLALVADVKVVLVDADTDLGELKELYNHLALNFIKKALNK
jgi:hypothetical protein